MNVKLKLLIVALLVLVLYSVGLCGYAQVTIGSNAAAGGGALLQLKENESDQENSTKGVGLPRVELPLLDKLMPMYSYENSANTPTAEDLEAHIGLIVYNVNRCLENRGGENGVYIWVGDKWVALNAQYVQNSDVIVETDQEGNSFRAREFKTADGSINAGIWMIENLKAKTFSTQGRTGYDQDIVVVMPSNPIIDQTSTDPQWCYPGADNSDGTDPTYLTKQLDLGLLYNWAAATNSKGKGDEAGTNSNHPSYSTGNSPHGFGGDGANTQGICPNGWHIPTDAEWNQLEQVIYTSPQLYSEYDRTESGWQTWNPAWNTTFDVYRPNISNSASNPGIAHGNAMKSTCEANDYSGRLKETYGKSFPSYRGGFAVLMTGYGYTSALSGGIVDSYGYVSRLWTSVGSGAPGSSGVGREFYSGGAGVGRHNFTRGYYNSVRCKKD